MREKLEKAFAGSRKTVKNLPDQLISGILMAWTSYVIIRTFEMKLFGWGGVLAFFILLMLIIYVYVPSGFPGVAIIAVVALTFAYVWSPASPYGATVRESTSFITEPMEKIVSMAQSGFHDLWLMLTDPNEYIKEKMYGNVEPEKPGYTAQGVEITKTDARPSLITDKDQEFNVYARIENKGGQKARNVSVIASCEEGDQCKLVPGGNFDSFERVLPVKSTKSYTLGPFKVMKEYKRSWKEYSSVKIKVDYEYETRTALDIEVMSSDEISRRLAAGESVYYSKKSTVDETMPPAAISLNVNEQPVEGGSREVIIVSVVNKGEGRIDINGREVSLVLPKIVHDDPDNPDDGYYKCKGRGVIVHNEDEDNDGENDFTRCVPGKECVITFSLSGSVMQAIYENPDKTDRYVNFLCEFTAAEPGNILKTSVATANFTFGYEVEKDAKVSIMQDLFKSEISGDPKVKCANQGGKICSNCMYEPIDSSDGGSGKNAQCCPDPDACENIYCSDAILAKIVAAAESEWNSADSHPSAGDNLCCRIDVRNMDGVIKNTELNQQLTDKINGLKTLPGSIYYFLGDGKVSKSDDFVWINYKHGIMEICNQNQKGSCECGFWSPNIKSEAECETDTVSAKEYCSYCCLCNPPLLTVGEAPEEGETYCVTGEDACEKACGSFGVRKFDYSLMCSEDPGMCKQHGVGFCNNDEASYLCCSDFGLEESDTARKYRYLAGSSCSDAGAGFENPWPTRYCESYAPDGNKCADLKEGARLTSNACCLPS